jgi:hypothetical protein
MSKRTFGIAMILLTVFPGSSQKVPEFSRVSSADLLDQLEAAMLMNELQKRPAANTVLLVKEIIMLNKMQLQDVENREYDSQHPGQKSPLGGLGDLKKPFYDLRNHICKSFDGILVDLDGHLRTGCD